MVPSKSARGFNLCIGRPNAYGHMSKWRVLVWFCPGVIGLWATTPLTLKVNNIWKLQQKYCKISYDHISIVNKFRKAHIYMYLRM